MYNKTLLRFQRDECGLLSIANAVLTLFLTIVLLCLYNVGVSVYDRTNSQQKADAVAKSLGNWKARNLNAVVSQQHLMGELLAMAIVHHAIGGDALDQGRVVKTTSLDTQLNVAYGLAQISNLPKPAYRDVREAIRAEAALFEARCELKKWLTRAYYGKFVGAAMQKYPPTAAAGLVIEWAAHLLELEIAREVKALKAYETKAKNLSASKIKLLKEHLPAAKKQLVKIVEDYRFSQAELAAHLESKFNVKIHIMPNDRRLPLAFDPMAPLKTLPAGWVPPTNCNCPTEPADNFRYQMVKVSQLMRATFPWVNYHRAPLIREMKIAAPLSKMGDFYFDHTAGYSKEFGDKYQRNSPLSNLSLYVLKDYAGPDKAMEPWTKPAGSAYADRSFGITAVVGTQTRHPVGDFFFHASEGDYSFRLASAMVWNRHEPVRPEHRIDLTCKRIVPSIQAETGWDTLNWKKGTIATELVGFGIPNHFPAIAPSWTSSMTPNSAARIKQLKVDKLPSWAAGLPKVLPSTLTPLEITL